MPITPGGDFELTIFCQARLEGHLRMADNFKRIGAERGIDPSIVERLVGDELRSAKMCRELLEVEE